MSDERGHMTPPELDELASAYLDGEATAQEAALVESDPGLQARVEELRAVRDLVAAPVDAPFDEVRNQMIAQALGHRSPVVSLERVRRRLRAVPPQARVTLAAAAVVAAIALVGVTLFQQIGENDGEQFADDSATSIEVAEAPAMDAPASAPVPESAAEPAAGIQSFDSEEYADDDMAAAPEPEMMAAEAPEEEPADEAPMDDSSTSAEPVEDDSELALPVASEEIMPTSEEALLVFDTQEDLEDHAMRFVDDLAATQSSESGREIDQIDSLACPLFTDEEVDLLTRFPAVVEGIEVEVSIYTGPQFAQRELLLVQTSPPPECEIHGSVIAMAWSTSP